MPPRIVPPIPLVGSPQPYHLRADLPLTRIHGRTRGLCDFNPIARGLDDIDGGRFDALTTDRFGYLYAADSDRTAVGETLVSFSKSKSGVGNTILTKALKNKKIGRFAAKTDLRLVDLVTDDSLATIGQDQWLTQCDSSDYPLTRQWCANIRRLADWSQGLIWRSRRDPAGHALMLFEDRCPPENFTIIPTIEQSGPNLHDGAARALIRRFAFARGVSV
ncbi:RES family NAD+ phosphorylase [Candidatus Poriferisodalis sp.]|uniref:RES family NAD+ phosphorylase n=1 Tax=Candidatus Poriferisodalis sp. TaxID=3101277 RepID=UPI003B528A2B